MALWITDGVLQSATSAPVAHSIQTDIQPKGDIIIPEGVTHIANNAFPYYSKISSITLPTTLTSMGNTTFTRTKYAFGKDLDIKIILPFDLKMVF